jgi:hypothetical protein
MRTVPFGTISPAFAQSERAGAIPVASEKPSAKPPARVNRRAEDTGAGCRANAAADLLRASAPGGDYMRQRLEHSAAVWTERAGLLERIERNFKRRTLAA